MSSSPPGSQPSSVWHPPSSEEMQAMLPNYRFEGLLGRGGMGAVYKAVQLSLDRPVAVKVLPGDLIGDLDHQFAERFKNEARTMARMSHPGIVNVYDFGETSSGLLYFVMEFIDGTDVAQMILGRGRLPEEHALSITAHVCDALAYAHARGVIHRDIKPANILINMQGQVKVADFGLAKQSDPSVTGLTRTDMAMGTPDFVAPEVLVSGTLLDGRADLYAVGVMLYNMLTGEVPRGMWAMPGQKVGCDPRFDAIIARAMQTDRESRYQSAADIRRDLDTIVSLPRSVLIQQQQAAAEAAAQAIRQQARAPVPEAVSPSAEPSSARADSRLWPVLGLAAVVVLGAGFWGLTSWGRRAEVPPKSKMESVASLTAKAPMPAPANAVPGTVAKAPASAPKPAPTVEDAAPKARAPSAGRKNDPPPMKGDPPPLATAKPNPPTVPASAGLAPVNPVSLRLAGLEKTFLDAYEKQVGATHRSAVADLNSKYVAALDRGMATVSKAGRLEEALALRAEKELVQKTGAVPEMDEEGALNSLKMLRKTWREQMAGLAAGRDQAAAPLFAAYDRALAAYQDELTRGQQLDDAARVKAVRGHVASERSSPVSSVASADASASHSGKGSPSTPLLAAPKAPPLPAARVLAPLEAASPQEIRSLCEWALKKDGRLTLRMDGRDVVFQKGEVLPKGRLTLVGFYVYQLSFEPADNEQPWFALLGRVADLEGIAFNKNPGTMPMEMLRGATKLKSLRLTPHAIDDTAMAHLSGLKDLEELSIGYMIRQFTGVGLGYIHEGLLSLSTSSPTLTAEGMAYLPRFKQLKKLSLRGDSLGGRTGSLTDAMLTGLAALTELEELDLSFRKLDGSFLAHMPTNSKLRRLTLEGMPGFQPDNLKHLARLKNLEFLNLPPVKLGEAEVRVIAGLNALKELHIHEVPTFTGEEWKGVRGFRSLSRLVAIGAPLSDAGLEAVANAVPDLKSFEFSNEDRFKVTLTAGGFARALARWNSMTGLQCHGQRTTDDWIPGIAQIKHLEYLMLTGARITDQGLLPLMKLPLEYLRLDGTLVTDAVIPVLKNCASLQDVPVGGTRMTPAGVAELGRWLKSKR